MFKRVLLFGGALVVTTVVALVLITARSIDKEELARVNQEMASIKGDIELKDNVTKLETEKWQAYEKGYEEAFSKRQRCYPTR